MTASHPDRVLLIGNYAPDRQTSMLRFSELLARTLPERGVPVELLRPAARCSRLALRAGGCAKWLGYVDKFLLFPHELRRAIGTLPPEVRKRTVVHICDHSNSPYVDHLDGLPHVITCHDLMAIRLASRGLEGPPVGWTGRVLQRRILTGLRRAEWAACDSESTRRDLLATASRAPEQTTTIRCQLNYAFAPVASERAWRLLEGKIQRLAGSLVLHVGNNSWYKNRDGVLRIFALARMLAPETAPRLLIIGRDFSTAQQKAVARLGLGDSVVHVSDASADELQAAYSVADVFLFPSLYEGFGWPPLEAQACGCPVVAGTGGSLAEILEESALAADARDEARLAGFAADLLCHPALRADVRSKGLRNAERFRGPRMIDEYIALYHRVLDDAPARS